MKLIVGLVHFAPFCARGFLAFFSGVQYQLPAVIKARLIAKIRIVTTEKAC